ncbi:hypothetical protein HYS92_01380 [Candidatus Daviesbacteria bacterium]|nr:hypothetical protein [Candidatus Daviesbacteria bacterium]
MENVDLPKSPSPNKFSERFIKPVLERFQRLKEGRATTFESQNPFGFATPDFSNLSEDQKRELWITQGGKEFKGEVGEVRRYVIGVRPHVVDQVKKNGFDPEKKRMGYTAFLPHFIGGTEGKGVYGTTNPTMASREYGPSIIVADFALGKVATPDKNHILKVLNKLHDPIRWSQSLYSAIAMVWGTGSFLLGETVVSPQAAVAIHTASLEDFIKKIQQHREWIVAKDPKRVKIVDVFPYLEAYQQKESELTRR